MVFIRYKAILQDALIVEIGAGDWRRDHAASTASGELGQRGGQLSTGDHSHDKGSKEEFSGLRA